MSQQRNNQQSEKVGAAWEKIFSYHVSDTGLVFEYIRNSYNSIAKKPKNLITKWAVGLNRFFVF